MLLKRMLGGLATLWLVATLTFLLMRVLPGGPFDRDRVVPPEVRANLNAQYHLDDPLPAQYGYFLQQLVRGDLGPSYQYRSRRVNDIVAEAGLTSFLLGGLALVVGVGAGWSLGLWAGVTRQPWVDRVIFLLGVGGMSTPAFLFGGLLVLLFAVTWGVLPAATLQSPAHCVLPVATLSLVPLAYTLLLTRTAVQDTLQLPHVRIKRSFGLPEAWILQRHVARNALLPLLSLLGPMAAALLTGSFAVETLFAVPGLGKYFVTAVVNRDYTLVMGVTMLYGSLLIVLNTLTDMGYALLDPRLRR